MKPVVLTRLRTEWLLLIAVQLIAAVTVTVSLLREQDILRDSEVDRLQRRARIIDDNLSQQLDGADKALLGVADAVAGLATGADPAPVTAQLKLLTAAMPGFSSMLWLGPDGTVRAASNEILIGKNFARREYFAAPVRVGDPVRLYVSPPFLSSIGTYVIVVSRMLIDAQGAFDGVVTATLDPAYFSVLLRSVLSAPDMRAALVHADGAVFLDLPGPTGKPGVQPPGLPALLAAHRERPDARVVDIDGTQIDGAVRLVGLRSLDRGEPMHDQKLVAMVSRELSAVLAPWHEQVRNEVAFLCFLVLLSSGGLWLDQRRRQQAEAARAAASQERQTAADRLDQALRGADLGLWELHVPTDTFLINFRERSLLGYGPADPLPQGPAWRLLIHPDDRAHVEAAILPHLKGKAPSYECEHRMLHRDGHHVWVSSRAMIVERGAGGAPVRIVGTHLEITAQKESDERLAAAAARVQASEAQLRLLADNMPALVSRIDPAQRFQFANRAYADWLEVDPAALVGRTLLEVYGNSAYETFRHHIERALAGSRVSYERELATPGGTRRVEFMLVPELDGHGAVTGFYALATDITARHAAEQRQARSEERLSIALEGSGQVLFDWNLVTERVYRSAGAAALLGGAANEGASSIAEMQRDVHPDDLPALLASARDAVTGKKPLYEAEMRLRHAAGDWVWIRARGRIVERDAAGRALRITGTYADISDRKLEEGRLRRLAEFDTLTGLPNRALFRDRLQQAMARATRGKPMALLFVDVDRFKQINDTLGHEAGDEVLKVFALRMQAVVRASDTVARLGGDEFTIILEAVGGAAEASAIAAKLNDALEQPLLLDGNLLVVTASIGVTICTPGESDSTALLRRADAALYEAKRLGRNSSFCAESAYA